MLTGCRAKGAMTEMVMPYAKEKPVLVVLDMDGTLSDSRRLGREQYKLIFGLMGYGEITDELADSFNGPDADEICRRMGIGPDRRPEYDRLLEETDMDLLKNYGRLYPGVEQMLRRLAPCAVLALLTNGQQFYCENTLKVFGLTPYIALHSGYVRGVTKAQRIAQWERELQARRVICVGDRKTDIDNAREVGAYAIGVTYGMGSRKELMLADSLCDTPEEVTQVILRLIAAGTENGAAKPPERKSV